MNDYLEYPPNKRRQVKGALVQSWTPGDMPHTKEQALAVLEHYGKTRQYLSPDRVARCHEVLTDPTPKPIKPTLCAGSHLGGWAYVTEEGTYGNFDNDQAGCALVANQYYAGKLMEWSMKTGRLDAIVDIVGSVK